MTPTSDKSIFLHALDMETPWERAAFLEGACAGNPALRAEMDELLHAHELPGNPLDAVPWNVSAVRASLAAVFGFDLEFLPEPPESLAIAERPGAVIGPYKLMEQIGEGGFGLVFVAEQQRPVKRKVALKIVKPGMDTREVIARFEAERQALAMMDHPNIAQVFDAGATDSGRPYFVMELVRGIPITDFCDQNQFTPRQRLELFVNVCQAVQHAHQKGIIHRDLKPSNILVTLHDGKPVVKVIDFGVAKAIGPHLTDKTVYTRFTQLIGTPLYMSPEQAEMSGLDVDTRSDIYSLGVALYELLTGTTPLGRERVQTAGLDEIRRMIREEEPPRPSTRLTTLGQALPTISEKRKTEPRKLSVLVRGDLDWIVMKALEKDRARRYDSAAALARDVQRYLNEEPVEARPPRRLYRFGKFARRNKVVLTTVLLVAAALVLGTAVSTWQAVQASSARAEADALRKRAEDFAERLKAANILLDSARAHSDARRWGPAYAEYSRAAELQPDHYLVWSGRGSLYVRVGLWKQAAADYAKALQLGAPANNPGWWGVPHLFLYTGDETSYRDACGVMLKQFQKSVDHNSTSIIIRSCLASNKFVTDPADLAERAETIMPKLPDAADYKLYAQTGYWPKKSGTDSKAARSGEQVTNSAPAGSFKGLNRYMVGPALFTAGLAHYRGGRHELAIKRLREALILDPGWSGKAISYPVLAMALHHASQPYDAQDALDNAEKAIDQWVQTMSQGPAGTMPLPWFEWLECVQLYAEAKVLVNGYAPPEDPRIRKIEQRGLAAINHH